jgi:hypothetical protein
MKSLKYFAFILTTLLLFSTSCKKEFFTDVNDNPNSPPQIVPYVLLSSTEGALGWTSGSTHSFFTSILTQQVEGASRQAFAYNQYIFTSQDFDDPWSNWYTSVMENDKTLMDIADSKGDNRYSGISRVIMAYAVQQVVDAWGSVPYSKALQGFNEFHPIYDNATDLYNNVIDKLLTDAISNLQNSTPGFDTPSQHGEDVIYGGDAESWIAFAYAIKARLYINQSEGDATMATKALGAVDSANTHGFTTAQYIFGGDETAANPMYQYNENRADISFTTSTLATTLEGNLDPRYDVLFDSTFNDVNGVGLGDFYGAPDAPAVLISTDELLFISAEARVRTGDFAGADADFKAAIQANMDRLGVDAASATAYIAANGTLPLTTVPAVAAIGYEEWVSLFLNPQAFTVWRRTDSPTLTPVSGGQVPRRFLYPQTEYTYNASNVPAATLYSPTLFWDN